MLKMIFKIKLALLGTLVLFAVSAVVSGSASAASVGFWTCQKVGAGGHWSNAHCSERGGTEEWSTKGLAGTETKGEEGTSGESKLKSTILAKNIEIRCLIARIRGVIFPNGATEGVIEFFECRIFINGVLSGVCFVKEPIVVPYRDQLFFNALGVVEDEFKPTKSEEVFVEIKIEGTGCALNNTYKVKGTQICELPNGQQALVTHEVVCTPSGSKLTLGSEKAEFTSTERVNLISGPQWGSS